MSLETTGISKELTSPNKEMNPGFRMLVVGIPFLAMLGVSWYIYTFAEKAQEERIQMAFKNKAISISNTLAIIIPCDYTSSYTIIILLQELFNTS